MVLGAKMHQAEKISQEEELLWENELLGLHSAQALVDTMVDLILLCGLDKSIEHCGIPPLR